MIANFSRDQLVELLLDLSISYPAIVNDIERSLPLMVADKSTSSNSEPLPIDPHLLRRQIKAELWTFIKSGYDSWGEDAFYDSDLGAVLEPALAQTHVNLDRGDPRTALTILEIATIAWGHGIDSLDDYVRESFEDVADEFSHEIGLLWAEALLTADLSSDEQQQWQEKLAELADTIYGGASLEIAVTAAEQGWTYPPLVAAMQGNITEKGAREDNAPDFADFLSQIRLRILAQCGKFQEYLNLAKAGGQFMLYLHMLVQQGQNDQTISEARQYLVVPENKNALSRTLVDHGEIQKAFQLAQHGANFRGCLESPSCGSAGDCGPREIGRSSSKYLSVRKNVPAGHRNRLSGYLVFEY